ncbi:hypothetical protein SVIOM74S_06014 [Streptomyces violarus]
MPDVAGREALPAHVVLDVRVVTQDRPGPCGTEHGVLQGGQPGQVEVLDHLAEHGGVVPLEPVVGVGERALEELDARGLPLPHAVQLQPAGGDGERAHRHVQSHDLRERRVLEESLHQLALAAAEIEHPGGPGGLEGGGDGLPALYGQRGRPLLGLGLRLDRVVDLLDLAVVGLGQPHQLQPLRRLPGQRPAAREVAAGDQLLLRVAGQPALTGAQQLVDLVGGDPVVLGVVQDREQDVEVAQGLGEGAVRGLQFEPDVARVAPLRELGVQRHGLGRDRPAQRFEEPPHEPLAAAGGQRRHLDAQRPGYAGQFGPRVADALHRAGEHAAQRHGEEGGGGVRAVVDVLRECRVRGAAPALALALAAPDQGHRVDLQQQRRRAALGVRLGVEDVGRAVGRGERLRLLGMLVQQEAEFGGGTLRGAGGRDGQKHGGSTFDQWPELRIRPPYRAITGSTREFSLASRSTGRSRGIQEERPRTRRCGGLT